jgi:hypothetical protein
VHKQHEHTIERLKQAAATEPVNLDAVPDTGVGQLDLDSMLAAGAVDDLSLPLDAVGEDNPAEASAAQLAAAQAVQQTSGDGRYLNVAKLKPMEKIRLALLGDIFQRFILIRDSNKAVAMSAIKSPKVNDNEVVAYAANRTLARDVVAYISRRREWTKLYSVQLNLVLNPKTPMAAAMNFLGRLYLHDVKKVAFSKNIPSALAMAARRRLDQRK